MSPTDADALIFGGCVLAGGQSQRMGQDKCQLLWQGVPLWQHMQQLLREAGAAPVLVAGPQQEGLADAVPQLGPLGGLASLAEHATDGIYVVVPVDMPRLEGQLIQTLVQTLQQAPAHHLSAHFQGQMLPQALRLNAASRAIIRHLAAQAGRLRSLKALSARLEALALPLPNNSAVSFANCNTPADWQALLDDVFGIESL